MFLYVTGYDLDSNIAFRQSLHFVLRQNNEGDMTDIFEIPQKNEMIINGKSKYCPVIMT